MTSGKVMVALLQLPALFHYGETLVTTTVEAPSIGRKISTALPDQFPGPSVWPPATQNSCCACGTTRSGPYVGYFSWPSSHAAATRRTCSWNLKVTLTVAVSRGRRMVRVRSCCLHMFPGIRDEIKIYSLPADCSDLFSAPDRGSFGASNSCALWQSTQKSLVSVRTRMASWTKVTGVLKSEFLHVSIQRSLLEVHDALDSMCSYIGTISSK